MAGSPAEKPSRRLRFSGQASGKDGLGRESEPKASGSRVGKKTLHLLHLAALALLLYFFALAARAFGVQVAFAIFLPLGILVELKFWWTLFTPAREDRRRPNG